ncbi:MAG: insulinase family protein [Fluviicola sp.]|nr:insulinase family protein [Fluviicola sp.]
MIDRTEQPPIQKIESVDFIAPEIHKISENVSLFHSKSVKDETTRFDLYFDAGKVQGNHGIAGFVNGLLLSGTKDKTSIEINNEINGLGGFYESGVAVENAVISIHCLLENVLPIFDTIMDAIQNVSFIEKEVTEFFSDSKQRMKINAEKVSYLAQKNFQKSLFHSDAKYAATLSLNDYDKVQIKDLKNFHSEAYLKGLTKVVVVGNLEKSIITHISESCSVIASQKFATFSEELKNQSGEKKVEKKGAIQSAIRVGRILFNKNHPDYLDFIVLNTILGDYFGSRLMSNIREDKGYTYGIGTMMAELQNTGYFLVATEVGHEVKEATLKEIKYEFKRLQTELVPEAELDLVKNYMLGQLLKSADGPYAMMDLFLSAEMHGKNLDFYNEAIARIQTVTSERVMELAKKYLNWEEMSVVVAG